MLRTAIVGIFVVVAGLALVAGSSAGQSSAEGPGSVEERRNITAYCGPGSWGSGICLDRRRDSVTVQLFGLCTSARSPKIRIRGRKIDAKKIYRVGGSKVKLRIKAKFNRKQTVAKGKVMMFWGGSDCTGEGFAKFKVRKPKR